MIDEVLTGCRALLERKRWLTDALCWTVIEQLGGALTVADVIGRLGGSAQNVISSDEADEASREFFDDRLLGRLMMVGPAVVLLEDNGYQGSRPEVLRKLSDSSRVHNVYWNATGNGRLSYAAHGSVVTVVDLYDNGRRAGTMPEALDDDLHRLGVGSGEGFRPLRAEFLALVEERTGVGLAACLADQSPTHVLLPALENDPRPPGILGTVDADLDVHLRLAPADVQLAEMRQLVDELAAGFDLAGEPAVQGAKALLRRGFARDFQDTQDMYTLVQRITVDYVARHRSGDAEPDGPLARRMQAARAIEAAVSRPGGWPDPLDVFYYASAAYGDEAWKPVREQLLARLTSLRRAPGG